MFRLFSLCAFSDVLKTKGFTYVLLAVFLIAALGYLLGRITIKGVSLGTAGVFLVAILVGYLFTLEGLGKIDWLKGFYIPSVDAAKDYKNVQSIGLVLFVTAVGFVAGPSFFRDLKKNAKSYVLLGTIIVLTGSLISIAFTVIPGIGSEFSVGVLSGALTSTPGFSAAQGVAENPAIVALGHAIAYPFGVIGVVLFVQLLPRMLKANYEEEREKMKIVAHGESIESEKKRFDIDPFGLCAFSITLVLGLLLGGLSIPLTGKGFDGACFSLGNTGGPLVMALIVGHFGGFGKISLKVPGSVLKTFREFGLMLFLIGAGVEGGVSLVEELSASELGGMLVLYGFIAGVVMTILPMFVGFLFAKYVLKIPLFNNLGSICGGMTSTPALGALIASTGTEDVGGAYAATYPISLVLVVLASNLIVSLL